MPAATHWQQEIQQRPELVKVVLQRRPCDEQPAFRRVETDNLREHAILILDPVRLIDHHVLPREFDLVRPRAKSAGQLHARGGYTGAFPYYP